MKKLALISISLIVLGVLLVSALNSKAIYPTPYPTITPNPKEIYISPVLVEKARNNPNEEVRAIIMFDKKPFGYKDSVKNLGAKIIHDYNIIEGLAISLPAGKLNKIMEFKNIKAIHEDKRGKALLHESVPLINADDVWSLGYNGTGIKVCVVDSGINYTHPALQGKVIAQKCYCDYWQGVACCPNGLPEDDNAMDDYYNDGHGTAVAGIIASQNSTYKGVSPGADLMAMKVVDQYGGGYESDFIKGVEWCVNNSANVMSVSIDYSIDPYSTYCDGDPVAIAVNNAADMGVISSAGSGNDGNTTAIGNPACASKAISVGASDKSDIIAPFTNRNNILDLLAPGVSITSTKIDGVFDRFGGTSFSTPHVSGAAAILMQANPTLTPAQIETILKQTGKPIYDSATGLTFPRIDVLNATLKALDMDSDGINYTNDNCQFVYNPDQNNTDNDGIGDVCDNCTDTDNDGYGNPGFLLNTCSLDNCPIVVNPDQNDTDSDNIGDVCDLCANDAQNDIDNDLICVGQDYKAPKIAGNDNCQFVYNPLQENNDTDSLGNVCDPCTDYEKETNYKVKGNVTSYNGTALNLIYDSCYNTDIVTEYYCQYNQIRKTRIPCFKLGYRTKISPTPYPFGYVCENGACIPKPTPTPIEQ